MITVEVPASTANLASGFDCLGLALGLHNRVELEAAESGLEVQVEGEGAERVPRDAGNLIVRAVHRLCEAYGRPAPGLRLRAHNEIPLSSGMGSSAAAVVGGLVAANALIGAGLSIQELLRLAAELEGHADNAAAALLGGLTLVATTPSGPIARRVEPAPMQVVIALPAVRLSTAEARAALPEQVPLPDAVFNIGHAALTVQAIEHGDFDLLAQVLDDRLHQPYRQALIPGYPAVAEAARRAGAAAVALSGAGPSLVAFARDGHGAIANAMRQAFADAGQPARTFVLPIEPRGVRLLPQASA